MNKMMKRRRAIKSRSRSPQSCCTEDNCYLCTNMKSADSTWDSDRYECAVCGLSYKTYDEEMK